MFRKSLLISVLTVLCSSLVAAGEFKEWCGENLGPVSDREGETSKFVEVDFLWILELDTKALVYVTFGPRDDLDSSLTIKGQSGVSLVDIQRDGDNLVFHEEGNEEVGMGFPFDSLSECDHSQSAEFVHFKETINLLKNPMFHACVERKPIDQECIEFFWNQFDLSGEGDVLSKAELSRLIRTVGIISTFFDLSWKLVSDSDAIPFEDLERNQILLFTYSVTFAEFLMDSMDYDSDGKLSIEELLHDRTIEDWIASVHYGILSSTFILESIQSKFLDISRNARVSR